MNGRHWILVAALALVIATLACGGGGGSDEPGDVEAYVMCQMFVKDRLKAPSTADFPATPYANIEQDGNLWTIDAWVDAENSFGAQIRTDFHCQVRYSDASEEWTLIELELEE